MQVKAVSKYIRVSPRKARIVADTIRGQKALRAFDTLKFTPRIAAKLISKTLKSAVANAEHNLQLNKEDLIVKSIMIDEGPTLKRFRPVAKGASHAINKRTSHISIILDDGKTEEKKSVKKKIKEDIKPEVTKEKKIEKEVPTQKTGTPTEASGKESHGSQG